MNKDEFFDAVARLLREYAQGEDDATFHTIHNEIGAAELLSALAALVSKVEGGDSKPCLSMDAWRALKRNRKASAGATYTVTSGGGGGSGGGTAATQQNGGEGHVVFQ
jgi:hypothetical protein